MHSAPISSQSLRSVASRSLAWTAAGKYLNAVLGLAVGAVLARVLEPRDFGLTALVGVLSGFLAVIADAGVSTTIVQKRDLPPEGVSSLFWTSVGLGAAMSALMLVVAPLMARFSGEPRLELITAVLGIGFLSTSIGKVPSGLLLRAMNFRAVAMSDLTAALVAGAVGITAALLGAGYWALVAQSLTNGFLNAIMRLAFARFVPELTFRWDLVRSASRYSTGILAFEAINYWARNLDKGLIGRFLGVAELGYYNRAYGLMLIPLDALNGILSPVLHPLLSQVQDQRERLARTYLKIVKLVASLAIPAMAMLAALAPELVRVLWGPRWDPSVHVFAILCFAGSVQPISATFGAAFLATNRTRLLAVVGLVNACVMMAGMALGVRFGIQGVATGYAIGYGLIFGPTLYIVVVKVLGARLRDVFTLFTTPILLGASVLGVLYGYNFLLRGRWPDALHLVVGLVLGTFVWARAFLSVDRALLGDAAELLPESPRKFLRRLGVEVKAT